jgi:hypothetical protein
MKLQAALVLAMTSPFKHVPEREADPGHPCIALTTWQDLLTCGSLDAYGDEEIGIFSTSLGPRIQAGGASDDGDGRVEPRLCNQPSYRSSR